MFHGDYSFFDYKYNILGYTGQDFGSVAQFVYLTISIILLVILLLALKKCSKDKVLKIIRYTGIFLTFFYITKTTWESIYDIKLSGFNYGLLPLDTCSIIMWACLIAGFVKNDKIKYMALSWIMTGSIVGGIGNMVYLNAFRYYPFFSFGAFYSMIWHFIMVYIGLLLIVTNYREMKYSIVVNAFFFHLVFSLVIIPIDFIFNFDFMLYKDLGGIPFFENVASMLSSNNMQFLNPIIMLILYFISFNIIFFLTFGIRKLINKININSLLKT